MMGKYQKAFGVGVSVAFMLGTALPVFAESTEKLTPEYKRAKMVAKATLECRQAASKEYTTTVLKVNADRKGDVRGITTMKKEALTQFQTKRGLCSACQIDARITHNVAVQKASADFKATHMESRSVLKTAVQAAGDDKTKIEEAWHVYKDAVKAAEKTMRSAKEAALVAFKTVSKTCPAMK